jgi:hypothetical protein
VRDRCHIIGGRVGRQPTDEPFDVRQFTCFRELPLLGPPRDLTGKEVSLPAVVGESERLPVHAMQPGKRVGHVEIHGAPIGGLDTWERAIGQTPAHPTFP